MALREEGGAVTWELTVAAAGKWSASMRALTASAMAPGGASQRPILPRSSSSAHDSPNAWPANPFLLTFSLHRRQCISPVVDIAKPCTNGTGVGHSLIWTYDEQVVAFLPLHDVLWYQPVPQLGSETNSKSPTASCGDMLILSWGPNFAITKTVRIAILESTTGTTQMLLPRAFQGLHG